MAKNRHFFGLDLSGPSNLADTVVVHAVRKSGKLIYRSMASELDDVRLLEWITERAKGDPFTIAIDAPLSYQSGGGLRDSDRSLRAFVKSNGFHAGIMPPTLTRMVYITLRGMNLARMLSAACPEGNVVENHPGTTLQANGLSSELARAMKTDSTSREKIASFLAGKIEQLPIDFGQNDHELAACGCILAAEAHERRENFWSQKAEPPQHPYAFVC